MNYAIYDPATGEIVSTGHSDQGLVPTWGSMLHVEITAEEAGHIDRLNWCVVDGQLAARDLPLDRIKADKWAEIKARREQLEFGTFLWNGKTFDGDAASQYRLSTAAQLGAMQGAGFSLVWTLHDNSTVTVTAVDLASIVATLAGQIAGYYDRARVLRDAIDAVTTAHDVAAITW